MQLHNEHYSLLIIGGGITGLTSAIAFAKNSDMNKENVLVLEQQNIVGGMVTSFRRKGFLFDTSQLISDPEDLFEYLEIDLPLKRFKNYFARIFLVKDGAVEKICIPNGVENFRNMLIEKYPEDKKAINKFFDYSKKMFDEVIHLKVEPSFIDILKILYKCPRTVLNSGKTFSEYFKKFGFKNSQIHEVFDVFAAFSGLPAERAVALMTTSAMNTSLNGTYRPERGFIQFPHALKKRAIELGCDVKTKSKVKRIIVDEGKAKGVELENGSVITADNLITTIDPKVLMNNLIGKEKLESISKKYTKKTEDVKMSTSSVTISLGLDDKIDLNALGLDCGYNVITTGEGTFEYLFKAFDRGVYLLDENRFHCAVICPSLTTGGKQVVTIRVVPMPMKDWSYWRENDPEKYQQEKDRVSSFYIKQVEKYLIPNLREHIEYVDVATPATFERYSGSPTGSNYDMAPYPNNFGLKRLKMRTPIKNLYQPKFSHGLWPSMQAGLQAVDMILGGKIMQGRSRYVGENFKK